MRSEQGHGRAEFSIVIPVLLLIATGIFAFLFHLRNVPASTTSGTSYSSFNDDSAPVEMSIEHARKRHGELVDTVVQQCNQGNYQIHMRRDSDNKDAFICFVEGNFWAVIKGNPINGDDIVTAFPRKTAKTIQDVIDYFIKSGYK